MAATMETKPHILIVEDDADMRRLLVDLLEPEYRVAAAAAPRQALALCEAQRFDLALLDVRLPEMSGLELLPLLRGLDPSMRVVLMTVRGVVPDAVRALRDLGVSDYIEKPFEIEDFRQRLRCALAGLQRDRRVVVGDLVLDAEAGCARRGDTTLPLSRQEFDLLLYLACHRDRPISWQELVREVWQCHVSCATPEMVRNAVRRLRVKLDDTGAKPRYIRTLRGVGYQVAEQPNETDTQVIRF